MVPGSEVDVVLDGYMSDIAMDDMAARSESAVEDSEPMIMMKKTATSRVIVTIAMPLMTAGCL